MKNLNILPDNAEIVFVALNPTEEAKNNGAVFPRDKSFWNILRDADIIDDHSKYKASEMAEVVFRRGELSKVVLGIADLKPDIFETDSRKVKVIKGDAALLASDLAKKKTKKIALMGQKVVDAFAKDFPNLRNWSNKRDYGKIGEIDIEGHVMEVFALPFPVNNNVSNKPEYFKKLN